MTVSYEEARAEATDYLAEADLHLARTGRLPSIPLPADLLRALLAGPPEPSEEAAERDVGRYLYNRLEALVHAGVKCPELDWIARMTEDQIKHMAERFLHWRLPENFNPDDGISFEPTYMGPGGVRYPRSPSGTNLFGYDQAVEMVRYMIEGLDPA